MLNTDILSSDEMLTLSVLDLCLTVGRTHQISNSLCDVAMKYLKLCETLDGTEHANLFLRIYQLFYESKSDASVTTVLCDVGIPLSVMEWREMNAFWNDLGNNYCAFNDDETASTGVETRSSRDDRLPGLKTLKKMSAVNNSEKKRYLQNVYSHLQLVRTIIPDTNGEFTRVFSSNKSLCRIPRVKPDQLIKRKKNISRVEQLVPILRYFVSLFFFFFQTTYRR